MFRVRAAADKEFAEDENWMVAKYNWPAVSYTISGKRDRFTLTTDELIIEGTFEPFRIEVFNKEHKIIHADADDGEISSGYKGDSAFCIKRLFADEHFFGFGERMDFIDQRGKSVTLNVGRGVAQDHIEGAYNILDANYAPVPL
jgi:hypothetical protein